MSWWCSRTPHSPSVTPPTRPPGVQRSSPREQEPPSSYIIYRLPPTKTVHLSLLCVKWCHIYTHHSYTYTSVTDTQYSDPFHVAWHAQCRLYVLCMMHACIIPSGKRGQHRAHIHLVVPTHYIVHNISQVLPIDTAQLLTHTYILHQESSVFFVCMNNAWIPRAIHALWWPGVKFSISRGKTRGHKSLCIPHQTNSLKTAWIIYSEVINNTSAKQTIPLHQGQHFFQRRNELP